MSAMNNVSDEASTAVIVEVEGQPTCDATIEILPSAVDASHEGPASGAETTRVPDAGALQGLPTQASFQDDQTLFMMANGLGIPNAPHMDEIVVQTTHGTIRRDISSIQLSISNWEITGDREIRNEKARMLGDALHEIKKHSATEVQLIFDARDDDKKDEWESFCDDVLYFAVLRFVILNKPLPIRLSLE